MLFSIDTSLALLAFSFLFIVSYLLRSWKRDRDFALAHGCQKPAQLSRLQNNIEQFKATQSKKWLEMWCRRYAEVGTTFESATISFRSIIFTIDPENLKTFLATDFNDFEHGGRRRHMMNPLLGPGIFNNDGPAWKRSRSLIQPSFTKIQYSDLSHFERHFQELLRVLPEESPQTKLVEVDLKPLFLRMTLDSASTLLFGRSMRFQSQMNPAGSKSSRFAEAFDRAQFWLLMRDYIHRGYMKPLGWIYLLRKGWKKDIFEENRDIVHSELDDIIREYLKVYHDRQLSGEKTVHEEDVDRYVFMDAMVETTEDPLELRCETLNVLMAARDSTASLLTNVFFMLARHPDVWDSLRTEVITTFGDRLPDYGTLRQMKQVRNVLNECLRLFPPLGYNGRQAKVNTTLPKGGGIDGQSPVLVKAGQQVDFHIWALHRSPNIFGSDSQVFRPDRWDDPELRPGWGFIPFNGGPRACLGQQMALTQASYTIVRLLQEFETIACRDPEPEWIESIALVTKSRNGAMVALKRAQKLE